jgi:hypothetical protein
VKPVFDGDCDSFQVAQAVSLPFFLKSIEETGTSGGLLWCEEDITAALETQMICTGLRSPVGQ